MTVCNTKFYYVIHMIFSQLIFTRLSLAPLGLEVKECGEVKGTERATPTESDVHANFLRRAGGS